LVLQFLTVMLRNTLKLNVISKRLCSKSVIRAFSEETSHSDFQKKVKQNVGDSVQVLDLIKKQITENPVMLYMKGTPKQPQCGFSGQVVRVLQSVGVQFSSVNVLEYPVVREAVKQYSDWPTLPQLYIGGEFVGGCDIVVDMHKNGELVTLLKSKNLLK